jgi:hypothetical protein
MRCEYMYVQSTYIHRSRRGSVFLMMLGLVWVLRSAGRHRFLSMYVLLISDIISTSRKGSEGACILYLTIQET